MSSYITTHNKDGKAVFSTKIPTEPHKIAIPAEISTGSHQIVYACDNFFPDLSTEADIDAYDLLRKDGRPPGTICPPNGMSVSLITFGVAKQSPWHRTMTLDILIVLEGILELHLDGGEVVTLKAGDTVTQRGTMHMWKDVTPNGGHAKIFGIAQPIQQPLKVGDLTLETEWNV